MRAIVPIILGWAALIFILHGQEWQANPFDVRFLVAYGLIISAIVRAVKTANAAKTAISPSRSPETLKVISENNQQAADAIAKAIAEAQRSQTPKRDSVSDPFAAPIGRSVRRYSALKDPLNWMTCLSAALLICILNNHLSFETQEATGATVGWFAGAALIVAVFGSLFSAFFRRTRENALFIRLAFFIAAAAVAFIDAAQRQADQSDNGLLTSVRQLIGEMRTGTDSSAVSTGRSELAVPPGLTEHDAVALRIFLDEARNLISATNQQAEQHRQDALRIMAGGARHLDTAHGIASVKSKLQDLRALTDAEEAQTIAMLDASLQRVKGLSVSLALKNSALDGYQEALKKSLPIYREQVNYRRQLIREADRACDFLRERLGHFRMVDGAVLFDAEADELKYDSLRAHMLELVGRNQQLTQQLKQITEQSLGRFEGLFTSKRK